MNSRRPADQCLAQATCAVRIVLTGAAGVLAFMRALGSSIGVAVVGAVGAASGIMVSAHESSINGTAVRAIEHVPGNVFAPVFIAVSLSFALSFVMLALMPERPLRGHVAS